MNFFADQEAARRRTGLLVLVFITTVLALAALVAGLFIVANRAMIPPDGPGQYGGSFWLAPETRTAGLIFLSVAAVIFAISLGRYLGMRAGGGEAIAASMGGKLVNGDTADPKLRTLLNVNAEMALAAGIPPPKLYLIEDPSVNAFAAGQRRSSAVIGVTRGALDTFDREELQGVIAHEYSHILNGDMAINLRLIAVIFGITVIGLLGSMLLRSAFFASRRNSMGLAVAGLALVVIGTVGTLAGRFIQAAVSRQREYLADASAVQFTRNPQGIGAALKKLLALGKARSMASTEAAELRHMLFAESPAFMGLATHPPLPERIRRVLPDWDGGIERELAKTQRAAADAPAEDGKSPPPVRRYPAFPGIGAAGFAMPHMAGISEDTGGPEHRPAAHAEQLQLAAAKRILASIPPAISKACDNALDAVALVHAMLMDHASEEVRARQLERLRDCAAPHVRDMAASTFLPALAQVGSTVRLALAELLVPVLRELSAQQYARFRTNMAALINADSKIDVFEWSLFAVLTMHLDEAFALAAPASGRKKLRQVRTELSYLLCVLAQHGSEPEQAYAHAASTLFAKPCSYQSVLDLGRLEKALGAVRLLAPMQKERAVKAMLATVMHDQNLNRDEAELLRAFAHLLDCPMPPLVSAAVSA